MQDVKEPLEFGNPATNCIFNARDSSDKHHILCLGLLQTCEDTELILWPYPQSTTNLENIPATHSLPNNSKQIPIERLIH